MKELGSKILEVCQPGGLRDCPGDAVRLRIGYFCLGLIGLVLFLRPMLETVIDETT
jgi:hypothetical protein